MNVAECKSCGAKILWGETQAGKKMPLDVEPVDGGEFILVVGQADLTRIISVVAYEKAQGYPPTPKCPRYRSHFATCPNAKAHRKKA